MGYIGTSPNTEATSILDGAVVTADLASDAVTEPKIADGAVKYNKLSANTAHFDRAQTFTKAQKGTVTDHGSLIANTTFRQDFSLSNNYKMTLAGNIVVNNPTNQVAGQQGMIEIVNGGSYTVSWGGDWDFASATAPTITSSGTDVLSYYVTSANNISVSALQAVS